MIAKSGNLNNDGAPYRCLQNSGQSWYCNRFRKFNSSLSSKSSSDLKVSVNQFSSATPENSNDPDKIYSSKFYQIEEMHNIGLPHKNILYPFFISMHFLLIKVLMTFNISWIALKKLTSISETRIIKQASLLNNLNLDNYSFEFTPTEGSAGGDFFTLLIIFLINVTMT